MDSNHRPSGYEPDELPLLHAASLRWHQSRRCARLTPLIGLVRGPCLPAGIPPVPAALQCFTSRFGMERGGSTAPHTHQWFKGQVKNTKHTRFHVITSRLNLLLFIREALVHARWLSAPVAGLPTPTAYPGRLPGDLPAYSCEGAHLRAHFPLRCCQRFLLPAIASEPAGRPTTPSPAGRPRRSSRTRRSSRQHPNRS